MTLALRLGRTLGELLGSMSGAEMMLWRAYASESPIGDARGDVQAALVASSVFQAQGGQVSLTDVLPQWGGEPKRAASSWSEFLANMRTDAS